MANEQNLRPFTSDQSHEEATKNGKIGGVASGEARRRKRDLRLAFEMLLEKSYTDKKGNTVTGAEAIALKQFERAMAGDPKSFEIVRDTVGQKPVDKVMIADVDQSIIDEVESLVRGEDDKV